jgi:UDP-GlcNAc:undecaprenyl-phosphate/decaprenyl-phosphate GlcNAc-1-phosphate transferase
MGDTGSLLLGLVNSILVIKFINSAGSTAGSFDIPAAPAIGFAILMVPLFDTLRVFGLRILDRRSPFSPDRNHVHHFLLDLGFSHKQITITCVSVNAAFVVLAYLSRNMGTTAVVGVLLFSALSLTSLLYYLRSRVKQTQQPVKKMEAEIIKRHKVLGMVPESLEVE